jgi:hypothetical protein
MSNESPWLYWNEALNGNFLEDLIQRGHPQLGCYRDKFRAVYIYRDDAGALGCRVTAGYAPRHDDEIDELFGFVCRKPIPYELYETIRDGGKWPEDVEAPAERGMGDNSKNLAPHEALSADISNLADAARDWLKSIGGKITTQEQADKAANYATEFGKLEKRGQDKHKAEKAPHLEAGRAVDAAWKPVIDLADQKKRFMKKAFETWAVEEQRKRSEEAARLRAEQERQAAEARAAAKAAGEPPPDEEEPPVVENVKAGTRGRVSMRTRTKWEITDRRAFVDYLLAMDAPPPDLLSTLDLIANRIGSAGGSPPGVEPKTISYAA